MFVAILRSTWEWTKGIVLGISALAFAIPAIAWRLGNDGLGVPEPHLAILEGFAFAGPFLAVLALLGAFLLAVVPWQIDGETKHVYALSLPLPWSRYAALRSAAGALLLLPPAAALYAGCLAALSRVALPPMLKAYPLALTLKFLLASWLAYALTFLLQYLAGRNATKVILLSVLGIVLGVTALEFLGLGAVTEAGGRFLFTWPGPFALFTQSWTLIDV